MANNLLVINVDIRETRVALIENGIIVEFHIERGGEERCLGNVVLGKVTRVLPGMQAAFIDVGLDKAAFLHVEDLIRPDDLEAYLSGSRKGQAERNEEEPDAAAADAVAKPAPEKREKREGRGERGRERGEKRETKPSPEPVEAPPAATFDAPAEADSEPTVVGATLVGEATGENAGNEGDPDAVPVEATEAEASEEAEAIDVEEAEEAGEEAAAEEGGEAEEGEEDEAAAEETPGEAKEGAAGAAEERKGGRRRRRRRRGGGREKGEPAAKAQGGKSQATKPARAPRRSDGKHELRIDKNTPIRDVVREGQEVLVQISKEPIGTKGARVTSHISLPGRYVVYLPTVDYVGVSKRIGSEKERQRLRETIEGMKPPTGGLIIRTVAEGLTKKQLKADVGYLVRLWGEIVKKREGARSPAVLYEELDLILKVARDMFTDEVEKIVIDDKTQYDRLTRFVEMFMPERVKDVELYTGEEPLFDAYGIEEEIQRALSRKVPLPSGGYLIIDEAEALTAIDVNTGRYVGKGSKDHEETILKTNLEAVEEIAYQLRFRNLGGLIVLDLIDMDRASSREQVRRRLEDLLQKDKAKTSLNRISELGLIEMTRKRTRESLGRLLHEPCDYCDGTGQVRSKSTVVYEILRAIRRERSSLQGYSIVVHAHPDVVQLMKGEEREAVREAEKRYMRRIDLTPHKEYHVEQFELVGR